MLIRILYLISLILTISACQSTLNSPQRGGDTGERDPAVLLTEAQSQKNLRQAARLRVKAAEILLLRNEYQQAVDALANLRTQEESPEQADDIARLRSKAWFGLSEFSLAEDSLAELSTWRVDDQLLLAEACNALSKFSCSADSFIQASLDAGLGSTALPSDIQDRIWFALSRAQKAPQVFAHNDHHAWWLLQEQIRTAGSITGQIQAWRAWQRKHPNHPASIRPPTALLMLNDYQTPQIALLLPLSGSFAAAGNAVRDGLITAYLSESGADKPKITFYDTGANSVGDLFEQALTDDAAVIVGPLLKQQVESFARLSQYSEVPRLMLNYLTSPATGNTDQDASGKLFQLGIAIEDEAESLANHVFLEGSERLLIVHSDATWSQRALSAFQESWPLEITAAPFADIKGVTNAVGEAMQVAASESRRRELADVLGKPLEFLPRARGDLDGVIALTTHVEAQALVPALKFHFANDLPVYATSQAARGDNIRDLNGFAITEMPIFATPTPAHDFLLREFDLHNNQFAELYALGFDAYRVATWLPLLNTHSKLALPGASGYLWLESGGKFRRDVPVSTIGVNGSLINRD